MSTLTNYDILHYVEQTGLPNFRGVFMRDTLPLKPQKIECGVMNLNQSYQAGSHWVCYYKNGNERIYFDSFGQITPIEIQRYLKTPYEFKSNEEVIHRNTDIVQNINSTNCGHLCLIVLHALARGMNFLTILSILRQRLHDGYS